MMAKLERMDPNHSRLQYQTNDAHKGKCHGPCCNRPLIQMVTLELYREEDGEVRVWRVSNSVRVLEHSMKKHKGTVPVSKSEKKLWNAFLQVLMIPLVSSGQLLDLHHLSDVVQTVNMDLTRFCC
jgi:hypothetical protein